MPTPHLCADSRLVPGRCQPATQSCVGSMRTRTVLHQPWLANWYPFPPEGGHKPLHNIRTVSSVTVVVLLSSSTNQKGPMCLRADGRPGCSIRRMEWPLEYLVRRRISPKICILGVDLPRQVKMGLVGEPNTVHEV